MLPQSILRTNYRIWILVGAIFINGINSIEESVYFENINIRGLQSFYPFEKFQGIEYPNKSEITSIRMKQIEFEPHVLIAALAELPNINTLYLENVVWSGRFESKLNFSNLNDIRITRNKWRIADCQSAQEFLDLIFFTTLNPMEVDRSCTIVIRGELDGSFAYYMYQLHLDQIPFDLQQYFQFEVLQLENSVLDVSKFNQSLLQKLSVINTVLLNGNVNDLLKKLNGTTQLKIANIRQSADVTFDLSLIPKPEILKELKLTGDSMVQLSNNQSIHFERMNDFELHNFRQLYLGNFEFPPRMHRFELKNITLASRDGLKYLTNLKNINTLRISISEETHSDFDLSYLLNSAKGINSLHLENLNLKLNSSVEIQFPRIFSLDLVNCVIDSGVVQRFSSVFNAVQQVTLVAQVNDEILDQFLNTSIEMFTIGRVRAIPRGSIKTLEFLANANISVKEDTVGIRNYDGVWKYIGESTNEDREIDSIIFYAYVMILSIICLLGIVGNVLSLMVLVRKNMKSSSSAMLIALSLFDMTILITLIVSFPLYGFKLVSLFLNIYQFPIGIYTSGTKIWILGDDPVNTVKNLEEILANYIYPLCKTAYTGSVYMTVVLTLERFLAVCYPLKVRSWTSIKKAKWLSLGVLVLAVSLNACRWLETSGSTIKVFWRRDPKRLAIVRPMLERVYSKPNILQHLIYRQVYHGFIWTIAMYIIPIPLLTLWNVMIWLQIRRSKNQRMEMSSNSQNSDMTSLTAMLLCVSLIFTICNTVTGAIVLIFVSYGSYDPRDIEVFSCIPIILNSSINFIIYCTLGKRFRAELVQMMANWIGFSWIRKYSESGLESNTYGVTNSRTSSSRGR